MAGVRTPLFHVDQPLLRRSRVWHHPVEDRIDENAGADDQERDQEKLECADDRAGGGRDIDLRLLRDLLLEFAIFGQGFPHGGGWERRYYKDAPSAGQEEATPVPRRSAAQSQECVPN